MSESWRIAKALNRIADAFEKKIEHWIKINPTPEEKTKTFNEKLKELEDALKEAVESMELKREEKKDGN